MDLLCLKIIFGDFELIVLEERINEMRGYLIDDMIVFMRQ